MSVLIKGMEMPESCTQCPCTFNLIYCLIAKKYFPQGLFGRPSWCPLVELPTPHGRLVDADSVLAQTKSEYWEKNPYQEGKEYGWNQAIDYIGNFAPTVIEAEE